jgi:LacI family transcriptional regulator
MKRVTIKDISQAVGYSTTTVTKALNGKPKLSEDVRTLVIETAKGLGYTPNKTARALARNAICLGAIVPQEPEEFHKYLRMGLEKGISDLSDLNVKGICLAVKDLSSIEDMKANIVKLCDAAVNGIILSPGFNSNEYKAMIDDITDKKIPVIYLVNEVLGTRNLGCVRMNGYVAGRMAAEFLHFCLGNDKTAAILTCNKEILTQKECIDGFTDEAKLNHLKVKGIYETQDDKKIAYYLTEKLIKETPDLGGIYVSSYNSVAVCQCIEDYGKKDEVFVIGQDLFPALTEKLMNSSLKATLFQDPFEQGRRAVELLYNHLTNENYDPGALLITPQIVFKSNLDSYKNKY